MVYKFIKKFFRWLFSWAKKTNDQTIQKIHDRVAAMASELEAQKVYQEAQTIKRESQQLTNQNEPEQTITKNEPIIVRLEQPPTVVETKTLDQKKRDQINVRRRIRYHLKKQEKLEKQKPKPKPTVSRGISPPIASKNKKDKSSKRKNKKT